MFKDGSLSLDILNKEWNPYITLAAIIEHVISTLYSPEMYVGNFSAAWLYFGYLFIFYYFYNHSKFWEVAKEWTERFANP